MAGFRKKMVMKFGWMFTSSQKPYDQIQAGMVKAENCDYRFHAVDGQANAHLDQVLSKQFKVAKSRIVIHKGELGRHKTVRITSPQQLPQF